MSTQSKIQQVSKLHREIIDNFNLYFDNFVIHWLTRKQIRLELFSAGVGSCRKTTLIGFIVVAARTICQNKEMPI